MTSSVLVLIVLGLTCIGFFLGRQRAHKTAARDKAKLHSLPGYYGQSVALFIAVPALFLLGAWLFVQPIMIESRVSAEIPESSIPDGGARSLVMFDVRRIADGLNILIAQGDVSEDQLTDMSADVTNVRSQLAAVGVALGSDVSPVVFEAAKDYRDVDRTASLIRTIAVLAVALGFGYWAWARITPSLRARNISETFVTALLMGSSLVAILTTVGIIGSLLFESISFFKMYPAKDFFLSATWNPQFRGGSDLGFLPLLWGSHRGRGLHP